MATKPKVVKIKDFNVFTNALAGEVRKGLNAMSKQLRAQKKGMVKQSKVTNRLGNMSSSLIIGEGMMDTKADMPIKPMIKSMMFGAKPHTYGARRKDYLVFFWKKENRWVTGRENFLTKKKKFEVNHPGMVGKGDVIRQAIDITLPRATPKLAKSIRSNIVDSFNLTIREVKAKSK